MSDITHPNQPKPTPADNLRQFERDVFDAMGSLTTAIAKGLVVNVSLSLAGVPIGRPQVTIFIANPEDPQKPKALRFTAPEHGHTFMHLLAMAGDAAHRNLVAVHSNTGSMDSYLQERYQIEKLREPPPRIIVPGTN